MFRNMQELQGEVKASQQPVHQSVEQVLEPYSQPSLTAEPMIPCPPEPKAKQTTKPPVKPEQLRPADLDFWKWATGKEVEEEEPPAWTWRNRLLYKGAKW